MQLSETDNFSASKLNKFFKQANVGCFGIFFDSVIFLNKIVLTTVSLQTNNPLNFYLVMHGKGRSISSSGSVFSLSYLLNSK